MPKPTNNPELKGAAGVVIASLLWGTTGVSASFAPSVPAIAIGAAAMGLGGILQALLVLNSIRHYQHQIMRQWRLLLLGGISVALYPLAFYAAMRLAGVTIGTVVSIGSAPLFAALIERLADKRPLSLQWLTAACCGIVGIGLLAAAPNSATVAASASVGGIMLGLLAGATYALYSWAARRMMLTAVPQKTAMGAIFGCGGLLLMPVLLLTGAPFLDSAQNFSVGLYMALVPMFIGYLCYGYGLAHVASSTATTISLLEPVVAALLAALLLNEQLTSVGWLGISLIMLCLLLVLLPNRGQQKGPATAEP
ncbi:membrane protein [Shewanella mangrovi]|uniref:Membrane protein n=1 Tax=Shewanella mangrovi TaxID=1515746 RepID=A0A094K2T3_9GAMM|nr:membrane protein [Shewanella mangrovi]